MPTGGAPLSGQQAPQVVAGVPAGAPTQQRPQQLPAQPSQPQQPPAQQSQSRQQEQMQQQGASPSHLQSVALAEIMQTDVVTTDSDTLLPSLSEMMEAEDVGTILITEDDQITGIVTDRHVALAISDSPDLEEVTAEDIMNDDITPAEESMSVRDVIQEMSDQHIRQLPVVGEDDEIVGITTLDEIVILLGGDLKDTVEMLETQSPRP